MNLNLRGQAIARVCFDAGLTLLTSGDYELRVENEAVLQLSGGDHVSFDPEAPDGAAPHLVRLNGDVIAEAEAGKAGDLTSLAR
ncbi:DUF6188 family protein [Streptomyces sp. NPDC048825]|uniref:DUF6188 family protein n=1 Tax=Streptomyces sp. NPDC048825 TaxID=3365592 RepID=UPI003714FCFE